MHKAKTPALQSSIGQELLKAGHFECEKRGRTPVVDGFVVRSSGRKTVRVTHEIARDGRKFDAATEPLRRKYRLVLLESYARTLQVAGYPARRGRDGSVVITVKER